MAFDATKPATSALIASAPVRANFEALQTSVGGVNLLADSTFLIWAGGDAAVPSHWTLTGTGVTISRAGTGLTDTSRKVGAFCPKVVSGAAISYLMQSVLTTSSYDDSFDGLKLSMGAWVKASNTSTARLIIDDGVTPSYSSYHTGGGAFEWLTATHTMSGSATKIEAGLYTIASGTSFMSGPTLLLGDVPPTNWHPSPCTYGTIYFPMSGVISAGTYKATYFPARPLIIKDVQLYIKTAPTGAAFKVDINRYISSVAQTMFTTKPEIAISGFAGSARPDGTYQYKCFPGASGSAYDGNLMTMDVDQIGSTIPGSDLAVHVRALQFARPLENLLGYNE